MTREHRKTIILAAMAAALVFIDILPLRTMTIRVDLPPERVAENVTITHVDTSIAQATGLLALALLIVTIVLIVWVVRRCIRHLADAKRPNPADVF